MGICTQEKDDRVGVDSTLLDWELRELEMRTGLLDPDDLRKLRMLCKCQDERIRARANQLTFRAASLDLTL